MNFRSILQNTVLTALFVLVAVPLLVTAYCYGNDANSCQTYYLYVFLTIAALAIVFASFAWRQFYKTHDVLGRKRNPKPIPHRKATTFDFVAGTFRVACSPFHATGKFFHEVLVGSYDPTAGEATSQILPILAEDGWVVEFEDKSWIMIHKNEFYHWLLDVVEIQNALQLQDRLRVESPISYRRHSSSKGRKTLMAYKILLEDVSALRQVNANVAVLKEKAINDPWMNIIKPLEGIRPVTKM